MRDSNCYGRLAQQWDRWRFCLRVNIISNGIPLGFVNSACLRALSVSKIERNE